MKKKPKRATRESEMRREYSFRGGVRGKYASRFREGAIAVVLAPDVARVFTDADSVNRALRLIAELVSRQAIRSPRGSNRPLQRTGSAGR